MATFHHGARNPFHSRIEKVRFGKKRAILVTGGAGFLGSHLCERFVEAGDYVVCADNFSTGRRRNIAPLEAHPNFSWLKHDVIDPLPVTLPRFDEIYNLACPASPVHYQADPVKTAKTSVLGIINVLERAVADGARVFHASTSEVYGDPQVHPQPEGYWGHVNPIGPRSCYDEGKRMAETLLLDYARQYGVEVRIARIFNTYGPRMDPDDGRVVSNFVTQALRGEDITIYGTGAQTRSFCYVDDLIEGIVRLTRSPQEIAGPVNIGNPHEFTIRELANMVLGMVRDTASRLVERPLPTDDPRQRKPDIGAARQLLDWQPTVMLQEGLARTIAYFAGVLAERPARRLEAKRSEDPAEARQIATPLLGVAE